MFVRTVTMPPQLKAGETEAQIGVPPIAANSHVSFLDTVVSVNDGQCACVLQFWFILVLSASPVTVSVSV